VKKNIHPELKLVKAKCACGAEFEVLSTKENLRIDVCSKCHPFFTDAGSMRFVDSEGRIEKFRRRYGENY
jgi:large subunit ribosomal protein L31